MMRTAIRRLMDTATSTGMLRTISVAATATADEFQGDSDGLKTNKQIQAAALKSGLAVVTTHYLGVGITRLAVPKLSLKVSFRWLKKKAASCWSIMNQG